MICIYDSSDITVLALGQHHSFPFPWKPACLWPGSRLSRKTFLKTTKQVQTHPMTCQGQIHSTLPPSVVLVSEASKEGWCQCPSQRAHPASLLRAGWVASGWEGHPCRQLPLLQPTRGWTLQIVCQCVLIYQSPQLEWVLASPSDGQKAQWASSITSLLTTVLSMPHC